MREACDIFWVREEGRIKSLWGVEYKFWEVSLGGEGNPWMRGIPHPPIVDSPVSLIIYVKSNRDVNSSLAQRNLKFSTLVRAKNS